MNELTPQQRAELNRRRLEAQIAIQENNRTPMQQLGERVGDFMGTAAPVAEDVARSGGSGLVRGATALLDTPGAIASGGARLIERGFDRMFGGNAPQWTQQIDEGFAGGPMSGEAAQRGVEALPGGEATLNYSPETTAGDYAKTVGEFIPGAMLGPGGVGGNVVRYGVLPGLASEAAGKATEGSAFEPYARIAAALLTPLATGHSTNRARPLFGADPEDARMAETLMRHGVRPTAGQVSNRPLLRRLEGSVGDVPGQADDVTAAAMRTTGSTARRATTDALQQAQDDIVQVMDDAVAGVTFVPSSQMAQDAQDVVTNYLRQTANANVVPDVDNVASEIIDLATRPQGGQVSLSTLQDWRSRLGSLVRGNNDATREAAFELRSIIDDATQAQLQALGRADDVARLATAREQYRNWLAVARASTRAGAENGIISPTALNRSVVNTEGWQRAAVGNTTELGRLSRAAAGVLRPESTVNPGGVRTISEQLMGGGLGAAAGMSVMPQNPGMGAALGAAAGNAAVEGGQRLFRSPAAQMMLMDPRSRIAQAMLAGPGAYAGQR